MTKKEFDQMRALIEKAYDKAFKEHHEAFRKQDLYKSDTTHELYDRLGNLKVMFCLNATAEYLIDKEEA